MTLIVQIVFIYISYMYVFFISYARLQIKEPRRMPIPHRMAGNQQTMFTSNITSINCICNHIEHNSSRYIKVYIYI